MKWLKWQVARLLDKRTDACWANLALWAMGWNSFSETFLIKHHNVSYWLNQSCNDDMAWCGKCFKRCKEERPVSNSQQVRIKEA